MKEPERNHIRLRGVGFRNIENRWALRKQVENAMIHESAG
jgi:hypothetical protein